MSEVVKPAPQRRTLVLLVAMFFLPLAASFILYYAVGWRPAGGTNHGELLQPLKQMPGAGRELEGKWALVYVGDGACDDACRNALFIARQTHLLLNKDIDRLDRALLATSGCCNRAFLDTEHEGIRVFDVSAEAERAELLAALPTGDQSNNLYVVDPLGNIVLRFDARENPKGLLEDLKKLLKLSHIG